MVINVTYSVPSTTTTTTTAVSTTMIDDETTTETTKATTISTTTLDGIVPTTTLDIDETTTTIYDKELDKRNDDGYTLDNVALYMIIGGAILIVLGVVFAVTYCYKLNINKNNEKNNDRNIEMINNAQKLEKVTSVEIDQDGPAPGTTQNEYKEVNDTNVENEEKEMELNETNKEGIDDDEHTEESDVDDMYNKVPLPDDEKEQFVDNEAYVTSNGGETLQHPNDAMIITSNTTDITPGYTQ